ncbi:MULTISPECIES: hypothetical protein [unclassified Micromonospora]|uniref:hypothetical protein n=1 Tax=unclassified Micromonospora TaxID=2617518 RepID=UPI001033FD6E|nr:hypothetical protein [Verrucosispora sp. SN26_14.1]TBL29548.1 hypothetical protein EYA84_24220 [Verrucosispora sp. SN26_14.1]
MTTAPRAGDLLLIGPQASVQFRRPILFRVIRVLTWTTYDGRIWLEGYQVNKRGEAVTRRAVFVQPAGLRTAPTRLPIRGPGRRKMPGTVWT